jgi:hypothetical protein
MGDRKYKLAPHGFEPWSKGPEPLMLGRYTTGLQLQEQNSSLKSYRLINVAFAGSICQLQQAGHGLN